MNRGFTLVELSIVLVIIGLLIGGILVGQSLIDSAKINKFVGELRQYEIAAMQFKQKFKYWPGDSSFFTPAGNQDSRVDTGPGTGACSPAPNSSLYRQEHYQIWAHLSQSGMLNKSYPALSPNSNWGTGCGGTHNLVGSSAKIWAPITEFNSTLSTLLGYDASPITALQYNRSTLSNSSNRNFGFNLAIDPSDVRILENKLSATTCNSSSLGLCNVGGLGGLFYDDNSGEYLYGELHYYIPSP